MNSSIFLLIIISALSLACNENTVRKDAGSVIKKNVQITKSDTNKVYICQSPYAYAYHKSPNCEGLAQCTHDIKSITLKEAIRLKRTKCRKCF